MVSGLEVAGLILGVIPVVITGIEYYKRGLGDKEVLQLCRSLKVQNDIFYCCIEELLASLASDSQLVTLLQDPGGPEWKDEALQLRLKVHLDHVYDSFFEALEDIKAMVIELRESLRLPIDGKELPDPKPTKLSRKILKKLKVFVSRSRNEKGLQRLTLKVGELETLIRQSSRLAPARRVRSSPTKTYRHIQESASDLYGALALGWDCNCETKHYANLLLEVRRSSNQVHDATASADVGFRFVVAFATCDDEQPSKWREVGVARLSDDHYVAKHARNDSEGSTEYPSTSASSSTFHGAHDIHLSLNSLQKPAPVGKSVSFKPASPTTITDQTASGTEPKEIEDLCQWIKDNEGVEWDSEFCLGYLRDGISKKRYGLYSVPNRKKPTARPWVSIPLAQVLSPTPNFSRRAQAPRHRKLSLAARVRLALTLGSTILQLHSTPWLDEAWDKHDIQFVPESSPETTTQSSDTTIQPYITREFRSRKSSVSSPVSPAIVSTPPARRPYTEKAWSKWVRNETLFTLGIMLIELALNRSIEQLAEPEDYGPSGEHSRGSMAEYFTAFRLQKVIREEVGSKYERAVAGCLHCDFGLNGTDLSLQNEEVQINVLRYIVAPLEESLEFYTSQDV